MLSAEQNPKAARAFSALSKAVRAVGFTAGLLACKAPLSESTAALEVAATPSTTPSPLGTTPAAELTLLATIEISGPDEFQPSGLVLKDGRLLTISDRHDTTLFELPLPDRYRPSPPSVYDAEPSTTNDAASPVTHTNDGTVRAQSGAAKVRPFLHFAPPDGLGRLDLEGLTLGPGGSVWAISEKRSRILQIDPTGHAHWVTPSLYSVARAVGCLERPNAFFEGLTTLPTGTVLIAAEREPRGLVEVAPELTDESLLESARAQLLPHQEAPLPAGRSSDLAGLTTAGDRVIGLSRATHSLVELTRSNGTWRVSQSWSFRKAETDPRWAYTDQRYGMGEGLAISQRFVFVVLDNNGKPHAEGENSTPLLFVFQRPKDL